MKRLIIAALLLATPAFAIDAPVVAEPPRVLPTSPGVIGPRPNTPKPAPRIPPSDNDPLPQFSQPDQMPCCIRDGAILYHAPLGIDRAGTRAYCAALDVAVVPVCKRWVRK